jgi:predicted nucleic acid-binding protein
LIVLDTSVIHALPDANDQRHRVARDWCAQVDDDLVTTPLVLAEARRRGQVRGSPAA